MILVRKTFIFLLEFQQRLKEIYGVEPKMAFVVVTKRINTRLFLNGNNPPPGTVADDYITSPDR
jgi:aubergine-like protein